MIKNAMVRDVALLSGLSHVKAQACIDYFVSALKAEILENKEVVVMNLGAFNVIDVSEKTLRSVRTGALFTVLPSKTVKFTPCTEWQVIP
jgi:nucleoid DNA-binding protein